MSDLIIKSTIHSGVSFLLRSHFSFLKNCFYHSIIILSSLSSSNHSQINSNYLQIRYHSHSHHSLIISYSILFIQFIHSIQPWSYDFYPQIVILNDSTLIHSSSFSDSMSLTSISFSQFNQHQITIWILLDHMNNRFKQSNTHFFLSRSFSFSFNSFVFDWFVLILTSTMIVVSIHDSTILILSMLNCV